MIICKTNALAKFRENEYKVIETPSEQLQLVDISKEIKGMPLTYDNQYGDHIDLKEVEAMIKSSDCFSENKEAKKLTIS